MLEICPSFPLTNLKILFLFCWKSASSSSSDFFAGNPFTASFPSVLAKSNLLSWKFGSLSPHLKNGVNPLSQYALCPLSGNSHPNLALGRLWFTTRQYWNFVYPSFFASQSSSFPILEIRLVIQLFRQIRPLFSVGNLHSLPLLCFFTGKMHTASFPSVLAKSDPLSWKFGSLSSLDAKAFFF